MIVIASRISSLVVAISTEDVLIDRVGDEEILSRDVGIFPLRISSVGGDVKRVIS